MKCRVGIMSVALALVLFSLDSRASDTLLTVKRKAPVGYDAGNMVGARRYRPKPLTEFVNDSFGDNLSVALMGNVGVPESADYGFATSAGVAVRKMLTSYLSLRWDIGGGHVPYNFDASVSGIFSTSASVLFNLSSYVMGYDRTRFFEVSTVLGVGYDYRFGSVPEHSFVADLGFNVAMRISRRLAVLVEPSLPVRLSGGGMSYGFNAGVGLEYDFSGKVERPSGAGKYFISLMGGGQFQNSILVRDAGVANSLGMHYAFGLGRVFKDYYALRFSAAYSHDIWAEYYGGFRMPAKYYLLRFEGLVDVLRLAMQRSSEPRLGCGLVAGPEFGYMSKIDLESHMKRHYVGLAVGAHADCRIFDWLKIFVEPRFSLVPYPASNDDSTSPNVNRNYYDALFNFNAGIDIYL